MPEKNVGQPQSLENQIADQIERNRSYERSAEGALERIGSTTLPWEVRMAVRDAELDFLDAPPGLGDNWGIQRLHAGLEEKRRFLAEHYPTDETRGTSARRAIGLAVEPWRDTPIITSQDKIEIMRRGVEQGMSAGSIKDLVIKTEENALARVPVLVKEYTRARTELVRTRKLHYLYWNFLNVASGNELGELYLQNKILSLPRPKDFAAMFSSVETPSYFMTKDEASIKIPDPGGLGAYTVKEAPDYPEESDIGAFMEEMGKSRENEPTGEITEKESRLLYLVALSENPERVIEWKHRTEQAEVFKLYEGAGVSKAYLILKQKGINFIDPTEEAKIDRVHRSLTPEMKQTIRDVWWKNMGFEGEEDGINGPQGIGDPEKWIPTRARRGDPPTDSEAFLDPGFDRAHRIEEIDHNLDSLKKAWQALSPLNNPSVADRSTAEQSVAKLTEHIRALTTRSSYDAAGNLIPIRNVKEELTTMFGSLPLERELGIRKGATEIGCIWSKSQKAGDKEWIIDSDDAPLKVFVKGDMLAFKNARMAVDMFGFSAKWGYYARDYDPAKDPSGNGTTLAWAVDVEGWPYTNEFQNILAWPWYQSYKREAGGPGGSRGKFGPLMTDYLSAYAVPEFDKDGEPMYDKAGNPQFVVVDGDGTLKIGRADEGVVVCDVNFTILQHWERGETLSNPKLWEKIDEDPFRRFLLRSFFAEGKAALGPGGNALLDLWKKQDWRIDDLVSAKFWDDYKLARKVALRKELLDEVVWRDVVKPLDDEYRKNAVELIDSLRGEGDPDARLKLMQKFSGLYDRWQASRLKEVFNYSDQMFWNGVASTNFFRETEIKNYMQKFGEYDPSSAKILMAKIISTAKSRDVNLIGNYSSSMTQESNNVKPSVGLAAEIQKDRARLLKKK